MEVSRYHLLLVAAITCISSASGEVSIFVEPWVQIPVYKNYNFSLPIYTPHTLVNQRLKKVGYVVKEIPSMFRGKINVDTVSGALFLKPSIYKFNPGTTVKYSFKLCLDVEKFIMFQGHVTSCVEIRLLVYSDTLSCSLGEENAGNLKEAVAPDNLNFSGCTRGCTEKCRGLGSVIQPVLGSICPHLTVTTKINSDNSGLSLIGNELVSTSTNMAPQNQQINFTIVYQITHKREKLVWKVPGHIKPKSGFPKTQDSESLQIPLKTIKDGEPKRLSFYLEAGDENRRFRFNTSCEFVTGIGEMSRKFKIFCQQGAYSGFKICQRGSKANPTMFSIPIKYNKSALAEKIHQMNRDSPDEKTNPSARCDLIITDLDLEMTSCNPTVSYSLEFFKSSPSAQKPTKPTNNKQIDNKEEVLEIKSTLKRFGRVTTIHFHQPKLIDCSNNTRTSIPGLYFGGNILYVNETSAWQKNLPNRICFQTNGKKIEKKTEIVPADLNCPSEEWCSTYAKEYDCISACHSITGERCQWVETMNRTSHDFTTCVPNLYCTDGICDDLEAKDPSICPQDCKDFTGEQKMFGTGLEGDYEQGIRGSRSANTTCTCSHSSCECLHSIYTDPKQSPTKTRLADFPPWVLFVTGCFLLVTVGITLMFVRRRKSKLERHSSDTVSMSVFDADSRSLSSTIATNMSMSNMLPLSSFTIDKKFEFPRNNLVFEETLGEGEFGRVVAAKALNLRGKSGYTRVAVKMLKPYHTPTQIQDLISEYTLLKNVNHPNVIRLLGACMDRRGPPYLIIEYAKHRSLRTFLRNCREQIEKTNPNKNKERRQKNSLSISTCSKLSTGGMSMYSKVSTTSNSTRCTGVPESMISHASLSEELNLLSDDSVYGEESTVYSITNADMLNFAWQVCKGMTYLSSKKLVHRDLAARNVLVAEGKICKVSDFGLSRDIYTEEAYWKLTSGKLPIKWMAPESLRDHIYTVKSDVWGFGILLWELATLGKSPYPAVQPDRLFPLLSAGYRMPKPSNCTQQMYGMMLDCWSQYPEERPTFPELEKRLERLLQTSAGYLDLEPVSVHNDCYMQNGLPTHYLNGRQSPQYGEEDKDGYLMPRNPPNAIVLVKSAKPNQPRRYSSAVVSPLYTCVNHTNNPELPTYSPSEESDNTTISEDNEPLVEKVTEESYHNKDTDNYHSKNYSPKRMLCRKKTLSSCHSSIEHLALPSKSIEYRGELCHSRDFDETSTLIGDGEENVEDHADIPAAVLDNDEDFEDSEVCHIINNPQDTLSLTRQELHLSPNIQQCCNHDHSGKHENSCTFDSAKNASTEPSPKARRHNSDSAQITSGSFDTHRQKCTPLQV